MHSSGSPEHRNLKARGSEHKARSQCNPRHSGHITEFTFHGKEAGRGHDPIAHSGWQGKKRAPGHHGEAGTPVRRLWQRSRAEVTVAGPGAGGWDGKKRALGVVLADLGDRLALG